MGALQRRKGHSFEREIAKDLQRAGFTEARRQLEYQEGEANGIDLKNTGRFLVQCKCMKQQPNVHQVMQEMHVESQEQIPVVVYRVTNKGTYVAFRYKDAFMLMSMFQRITKSNQ